MNNPYRNAFHYAVLIALLFIFGSITILADEEWELVSVIGRGAIYELDLSPDDSMLAVATSIGVWIYDSQTFDVLHFFGGYRSRVETIGWSPDSKQLVVGGYYGELDIWDVASEQRTRLFDEDQWWIEATAWSPDGNMIAFSTSWIDDIIRLWNVAEEKIVLEIDDLAISLAWSPDNSLLATGSRDTLDIRDATTGESVSRFHVATRAYEWPFRSIAWSPDGTRIASTNDDGPISIWTVADRELLYLRDNYFGFSNIVWSPDGRHIASGTRDKTVIFDSISGEVTKTIESTIQGVPRIRGQHRKRSVHIQWSSDGQTIYTTGWDEHINRWNVNTGELLSSTDGHYRFISTMEWSPNQNIIAVGTFDSLIRLWDGTTGEHIVSLYGHEDTITALSWSHDGTKLASGSFDIRPGTPRKQSDTYGQTVRIWDAESGQSLHALAGHTLAISNLSWSSDGTQLASGSHDETISIWDTQTGEELHELDLSDYPQDIVWSPDGTKLASGAGIWDTITGEELYVQELTSAYNSDNDEDALLSIVSFDHSLRAVDNDNGTIQLWRKVEN